MTFISHYLIKSNDICKWCNAICKFRIFFWVLRQQLQVLSKAAQMIPLCWTYWTRMTFNPFYLFIRRNFIRETASTRYELTSPNLQEITSAMLEGPKAKLVYPFTEFLLMTNLLIHGQLYQEDQQIEEKLVKQWLNSSDLKSHPPTNPNF